MIRLVPILVLSISFLLGCNSKQPNHLGNLKDNDTLSYKIPKEYDTSVYIGTVTGMSLDSFQQKGYGFRDSLFKLDELTRSSNKIEIRFFTLNYWSDTSYCIILSYDTSFSIVGFKNYYTYYTSTNNIKDSKQVLTKVQLKTNPDTLFEKLVENGIFSLGTACVLDSKYPILELTKNGFTDGSIVGDVLDGVDYTLEYKVDKFFDHININNPTTHFYHNPDKQTYRRKFEIAKLMLSGLQ
jgi:hypothetical protein